jgi:hypothetical protein
MPPEEDGRIASRRALTLPSVTARLGRGDPESGADWGHQGPELAPEDEDGLIIFDGRRLGEWATAIAAEDSKGGRYVRRLADASRPTRAVQPDVEPDL